MIPADLPENEVARLEAAARPSAGGTPDEAPSREDGDPAHARDRAASAPGLPVRVLLVEDNYDNRFLVHAYLGDDRFEIEDAADGREAVERFTAGRYDIVLMDMQLPVMDGFAATRTIRGWECIQGRKATPILAMTAHAMVEDRARCLDAGCDEHVAKPILRRHLLEAVARHVDKLEPEPRAARPAALDAATNAVRAQYLCNRLRDLDRVSAALEAEDFETVRRLGHSMKGTGASFGYTRISELGACIEAAAAERDAGSAELKLKELALCLDRVRREGSELPTG